MKKLIAFILLILLTGCVVQSQSNSGTRHSNNAANEVSSEVSSEEFFPVFMGEWEIRQFHDIAWNSSSTEFAVKHFNLAGTGTGLNIFIVDLSSNEVMWEVDDSVSAGLLFTNDDNQLIEANIFSPGFFIRDSANGENLDKLEDDVNCSIGGHILLQNKEDEIIYTTSWTDLTASGPNRMVSINRWDMDEKTCEEIINYEGNYDVFDINTSGTKLAYGGINEENEIVIWDTQKNETLCQYKAAEVGRFIPDSDIFVVIQDGEMNFVDFVPCESMRTLPINTIGNNLAISSEGNMVATIDKEIEIHDMDSGELLMSMPIPQGAGAFDDKTYYHGLVISPDGKYLTVAFKKDKYHGVLQLWQILPGDGAE